MVHKQTKKKQSEPWTKEKVVRSVQNILKHRSIEYLSEPAYYFFHMHCGSIAHFNKEGWAATYRDLRDFANFFLVSNEYGHCLQDPPEFMNLTKEQRETILLVVSLCREYRAQVFVELDQRDRRLSEEIGRGLVSGEMSIREIADPESVISIKKRVSEKLEDASSPRLQKVRRERQEVLS